ncbi:hypothetical protein VCRA2121O157_10279 [Vibrio crassostreae]|nr:hypothetical protein VCRA2114E5_100163 [Vibrio crassostreae]CAK1730086.1 hypothetical protein VCRA2119O381_1190011 [Vibrio crassostreae]CAK1783474.1 hypothetical protein VCRA2119O431_170012 [Vibrio crassostreae]CAK1786292.1 hypothetical protein VCRA2114O422_170012 [Vibrio crassostreae]CAK1797341.1 hypothetical protein VCRA2113O409_170092 [Vibrio crassostreae]
MVRLVLDVLPIEEGGKPFIETMLKKFCT